MQQTDTKGEQDKTRLGGKGDPQKIVQEVEIWPYYPMIYARTRMRPREWDVRYFLRFLYINEPPNPSQKTRPSVNLKNKKKGICHPVDFAVSADHKWKLKYWNDRQILNLVN